MSPSDQCCGCVTLQVRKVSGVVDASCGCWAAADDPGKDEDFEDDDDFCSRALAFSAVVAILSRGFIIAAGRAAAVAVGCEAVETALRPRR